MSDQVRLEVRTHEARYNCRGPSKPATKSGRAPSRLRRSTWAVPVGPVGPRQARRPANLTGLVLGCIEAKICNKMCVWKLSPRSTQCTPLHSSVISFFVKCCQNSAKFCKISNISEKFRKFSKKNCWICWILQNFAKKKWQKNERLQSCAKECIV